MKPVYRIAANADEALVRVGSAETKAGSLSTQIGSVSIRTNSLYDLSVGSASTLRIANVASVGTTIPVAGTVRYDTTRKVLVVSDGTSFFLSTGSLA